MSYEKFVVKEHGFYKTYSSASEAFKDADYASPITYFEDSQSRTLRYIEDKFAGFIIGVGVGFMISLFLR